MNNIIKTSVYLLASVITFLSLTNTDFVAKAEDENILVTEYADLWTGNITVKTGEPVKWYVNVPEGTEPKGCSATIKIPGLNWGTDTHNKEEGHLTLEQGENFVYEFTPEETGDILFTCWMGSGCHYNYIHVTDNGVYDVPVPAEPDEISAVWDENTVKVSFKAVEAPEGAEITGYKVIATDENDKRKKVTVTESPAVFEELDKSQSYTIKVITLATSGQSESTKKYVLDKVSEPVEESATQPEKLSEYQEIVTEYADLWTGNITVKAGTPVKWYVSVPEDTQLTGCAKTIKIPGLNWGTDTHNKEEGHLTLEQGKNFVYEFTPVETGDILFTCWMGSGCHYNYIHVTQDGISAENAVTSNITTETTTSVAYESTAPTTAVNISTSNKVTSTTSVSLANTSDNPQTGVSDVNMPELILGISSSILFVTRKRRTKSS